MAWRIRPHKLLSRDSFFLDTDKALEVAVKGPVSAVYADVLRMRIRQRRKKSLPVPRDAYEIERGNELYFALLNEIEEEAGVVLDFQEDEGKCTEDFSELQGELEKQLGEPLWYVVDALCERIAKETNVDLQDQIGNIGRELPLKCIDDTDMSWQIFWEHYRGDGAKTTSKEVAVQRSHGRKPLLPKGGNDNMSNMRQLGQPIGPRTTVSPEHRTKMLARQATRATRMRNADASARHLCEMMRKQRSPTGAPSMSSKIMQEMQVFEEHERRRITGEEERMRHLAQRLTMEERQEDSSDDEDSNGCESPATPGRPLRKLLSRSLSRSSSIGKQNRLKERRKAVRNDMQMHKASLPFVESPHMPPVFCFQGFDDYKRWQHATDVPHSARERGTREIVKVAAKSPQAHWSSAVREHEAAAHWRRTRRSNGEIDGGPLVRGSDDHEHALVSVSVPCSPQPTARLTSPRAPSIGRTATNHDRSVQSTSSTTPRPPPPKTQPADFHRPWSRGGNRRDNVEEHENDAENKAIVDMKELKSLEPLERFAKICRHTGVHPQPCTIKFLATLPPRMDVRGMGFADEDLLSLVAALPYKGGIEAVDSGENPRLTDASICTLLRTLADRHCDSLSILKIDHCHRLGRETISLCTKLLETSLSEVQVLDISGIQVPLQEFSSLSLAVKRHMKLRDVRLAETGLGMYDRAQGSTVIANLVAVPQLEYLDIGWNSLDAMAFHTLGKGLVYHEHLKSLGMSNTGAKVDSEIGGSPVLVFLEFLEKDNSLTYLDISNNSFDDYASITLECAACRHPKLYHIDLSQNQLGPTARRSMIRLLANLDCPHLVKFTANECRRGMGDSPCIDPFVTDPTGPWTLNLAQPSNRAILKLLLMRFSEGATGLPPVKLFKNARITRDEGVVSNFNAESLKRKGDKQVWDVPSFGELQFDFSAGEFLLKDLDDKTVPSDVVHRMVEKTRLKLKGRKKTLAVLSLCKGEQDEDDRATWLEAISQDFQLSPEQVKALSHSQSSRSSSAKDPGGTICRLLPCLMDASQVRKAVLCTHNLSELLRVHTHGHHLLSLHIDNPTGHYHFHLSEPPDRNAAEKLMLLNRWEVHVWLASGKIDISQYQNLKNVRNEMYDNTVKERQAEEWGIFGSKELEFDYVSLRRPPQNATAISDATWQTIIDTIQLTITDSLEGMIEEMEKDEEHEEEGEGCNSTTTTATTSSLQRLKESPKETKPKAKAKKSPKKKNSKRLSGLDDDFKERLKELGSKQTSGWERSAATSLSACDVIWALRACSSRVWLLCRHVRQLLCLFSRRQARKQALTCMALRTLDWPCNHKLLRAKFSVQAWKELEKRLGSIVMFPYFQPENTSFQYDLRIPEQRRCLSFLTQLAAAEHHKNIKKPQIDWRGPHPNPEWDNFLAGIPITWTNYDSISTKGLFECTYTCSMDMIAMRTRRQFAAKVGGWSNLPEGKQDLSNWITYWSILDEVPREVIIVLEFIHIHFKSLSHVFDAIDANHDKTVTYREFMTGMKKKMRDCGFGLGQPESREDGKKKPKKKDTTPDDIDDSADRKDITPDGIEIGEDRERGEEKRMTSRRGARMELDRKLVEDSKGTAKAGVDDDRLTEILTIAFKFLDPNNDAELSLNELGVLEGVWRELQLTLWEFVQHMTDCFGSLENAWKIADKDHSDSVDYETFATLSELWQFDGPVKQIFMYLDRDGNGTIGCAEWAALSRCEKPTSSGIIGRAESSRATMVGGFQSESSRATMIGGFQSESSRATMIGGFQSLSSKLV